MEIVPLSGVFKLCMFSISEADYFVCVSREGDGQACLSLLCLQM